MTDVRPIGIADLRQAAVVESGVVCEVADDYSPHPAMGGHWYWCRRHEQAVQSDGYCDCTCRGKDDWHNRPPGSVFHDGTCPQHPHNHDCVRIGPFMSESEANRLSGHDKHDIAQPSWRGRLGMEVEQ